VEDSEKETMTSAASINNPAKRIQRAEIFTDSWNGVRAKLQAIYGKSSAVCESDIQVVPCGNADDIEALMQQKGMKYQLPVIGISLASVEPNNESYNKHLLRKDGYRFKINEGREWYTFVKAMPSIITFQVLLFSDDIVTMLRMMDRWMNNETWGFEIKYPNWAARIKVTADKNLSMPPRVAGSGGSEQYKLAANLRVETYAGYVWQVPAIRAVDIVSYFPMGALNTNLDAGQSLEEALNSGAYPVATNGIIALSRTTEGATDPAGLDIPWEPAL